MSSKMNSYRKNNAPNFFQGEVEGGLQVRPDLIIFPLRVVSKEQSNVIAMRNAKKFFEELEQKIKAQFPQINISLEPGIYSERYQESLKSIIFGNKEKNYFRVELNFFLKVPMTEESSFWERSELFSEMLDLLKSVEEKQHDQKTFAFECAEPEYKVENQEMYRSQIVKILYEKMMTMANVIGDEETSVPFVQKVVFEPRISVSMVNITKAFLSLRANFELGFSTPSEN